MSEKGRFKEIKEKIYIRRPQLLLPGMKVAEEYPGLYEYANFELPQEELFLPGHGLCASCTIGVIARHMLKVLGPDTVVVNPTGCAEVSTVVYPRTNWAVPWIHVAFGNGGSVASGIEAAIKVLKRRGVIDPNRKINVVVFAGDGGTADIGFQALSGLLERGHKVIYVMYDNEGYMNTGIQRSGTTPLGASTTTAPAGRKVPGNVTHKKPMAAIAAAHGIPYVATANPAYVHDMVYKFKKAAEAEGPAFLHILQSCTPGWRFEPKYAIRVLELATETGYWVNYEIDHGEFRVTLPVPRRKPVKCFLELQGRFKHLKPEEVEAIQAVIDRDVEEINRIMGKEVIGPVDPSLPCITPRGAR
ncbi:thiamine pyrophosphate enzyme domain protein TPP-binding protein [Pyrobaculum ferrireducens]|uniref:2-oxoacid oxidoreductase (ferredoxin) n=2 Tax=Pyrobaculum ferrireducens TaxID=1104324 RepID=G7VAU6_9CREN|nr:thiamine pyrophosphate enzyme domain protein TPP-binding protein [Pyrobaculum ferrireducens]